MSTGYRPPLMITVAEAAELMSMTLHALHGKIRRGTSGLTVHHTGKTVRVSLKSVLAAADMTLAEYMEWRAECSPERIRGAA